MNTNKTDINELTCDFACMTDINEIVVNEIVVKEELLRVIIGAERWQTIDSARHALSAVRRMADSMNSEVKKHHSDNSGDSPISSYKKE